MAVVLAGLFATVIGFVSLSRAGSALFWRTGETAAGAVSAHPMELAPVVALIASAGALVILAAPLEAYSQAAADQLLDRAAYVDAVLGNAGVSTRASVVETRP